MFDDYAHHPTELRAALAAARTVASGHRVLVLFQPHLFSRTREFATEFGQALGLADAAVVLDVFPAREDPIPGVDGGLITATDPALVFQPDREAAIALLAAQARPGDIVLTIGAGDVTEAGQALLLALRAAGTPAAGGRFHGG